MEHSLAKKFLFGTFWGVFGNAFGLIVGFISQLILVRLLIPEDFGLFAFSISILEVFYFFFYFSIPTAIIRSKPKDGLYATGFYLILLQGVLVFFVTALLIFVLSIFTSSYNLLLTLICLASIRPISLFANYFVAILEKELKFKMASILRSVALALSSILAVLVAFTSSGLISLLVKQFTLQVFMLLGCFFSGINFKGGFDKTIAKKIVKFSSKIIFARGFESVINRLDSILLGAFFGITSLGFYTQAKYIVNIPEQINGVISSRISLPILSEIKKDNEKLLNAFHSIFYILIRMLLFGSIWFFLFADQIVLVLFGDEWIPTIPLLKAIALLPFFASIFNFMQTYCYILNKPEIIAKARLFQILLAVIFMCLFGFLFGKELSIYAYVSSFLIGVMFVYLNLYKLKYLNFEFVNLSLLKLFIANLIVFGGICYLKVSKLHSLINENLIISFICTLMLYLAGLLIFETKKFISKIRYLFRLVK